MATLMLGVLVINRRFMPNTDAGPFGFGVVAHTVSVLRILEEEDSFAGFLLYERDETVSEPHIETTSVLGRRAMVLRFHFSMAPEAVSRAIDACVTRLMAGDQRQAPPLLYYQTNVMLPFHPRSYGLAVTHHAPFVSHLIESVGREVAVEAFGGGRSKLDHLALVQEWGLAALRFHDRSTAIELSGIQQAYLIRRGISADRAVRVLPPVTIATKADTGRARELLSGFGTSTVLLTAVARLDGFKNVQLLVRAACELMRAGANVRVVVVGGTDGDDGQRRELAHLVSPECRDRFRFAPRLARAELAGLFDLLCRRGIFVCTSRYETCGLTPLEAVARGMRAIVPDAPSQVEVSSLLPRQNRYAPNVSGLVDKLRQLCLSENLPVNGSVEVDWDFREEFLEAWSTAESIANRHEELANG